MFYSMTYSGILQPWLSGVVYGGTKLNITQDHFWVNVIKFHRIIFGSRWLHVFRGGITQGSIEEHCKVNYKQASARTRPQHVFCITWGCNLLCGLVSETVDIYLERSVEDLHQEENFEDEEEEEEEVSTEDHGNELWRNETMPGTAS